MRILLIILTFFMLIGCTMAPKRTETLDRDQKIINCTKSFLGHYLKGTTSYEICKDIYKRVD